MSVRSVPAQNGQAVKPTPPIRRVMAVVAQLASYMTTLWAVQWVWDDGPLGYQVLAAAVVEVLLIAMKSALFNGDGGDDTIGWAGFVIDAIVNAGGVLPRAGKLLTWPPIAGIFALFGIDGADPTVQAVGAFLIAAATGILLSVLPHRLWKDKG